MYSTDHFEPELLKIRFKDAERFEKFYWIFTNYRYLYLDPNVYANCYYRDHYNPQWEHPTWEYPFSCTQIQSLCISPYRDNDNNEFDLDNFLIDKHAKFKHITEIITRFVLLDIKNITEYHALREVIH